MSDLPVLPDVSFLETDPQQIINEIISGYEAIAGYELGAADPRRLFLLSLAYVIVQQRQLIDSTGKSNLLYYATGDFLDYLGAMRNTPRIGELPSVTTERFTLSTTRPNSVGIPQGTRVTADNQIYWRTTEPASIPAGQLYIDVPIESINTGETANGIAIGSINSLVDPIPYVQSVTNTEVSSGGRDEEKDDPYRERIYQAPIGFSIAGPEDAYIYWARTASSAIIDVSARSPSAGVAEIRPLLDGGELPNQALLDKVYDTLSDKKIRPLTDQVQVLAPEQVSYSIDLTYYIRSIDAASAANIQVKVNSAIDAFVAWQDTKLGRDINPDELTYLLKSAGVKRVVYVTPVFTEIEKYQVAKVGTITANYGGTEDD